MALRGDLASVDLAQVFQMLAMNKKVGLLSIQGTRLSKVLYFDQRGVTVHHNVHRVLDRVVASLCRTGQLAETALDEVRDHAARMGQPLADSLLAGGYLAAAELEEQYRIELEEEVYDLFFCKDARFEFHEDQDHLEGVDGVVDERFFFNCDSVIMEAARRIDEWTYISERVPTTAEVLVAVADAIGVDDYGPDGPAVFQLLDGRRNVARVVEMTGLSTFQVCKALSQMLDAGVVAPVAPEELLPQAERCMAEGRLQDAISLYERATGLGVGVPEVHSLAAAAYQAAEEYEHAIYHLECEAEARIAAGDRAGAAQKLFEVRQLVPTDLQARERLVELTLGPTGVGLPNFEPMAEGKQLVELLLEFGDVQRVRTLLERLLLVSPADPDLKKALVNVHIKSGDQKRVLELYESIADDLVRDQRPLEAVGYLQKILLIDRSRADVSERVRHLYEYDERSRRRVRLLNSLAVVFCVLLVAGSGYWFYNQRAEEDFRRIDVHEMLAREDFAGAIGAYDEFIRSHPLTVAVARAEAELQQIGAAQKRFEARLATERAGREQAQQKVRTEYQALWGKQRELFLAGQPEAAAEALAKVRELLQAAGGAEDMAWAHEQQVERTWQKLREQLDLATQLASRSAEQLAAGQWQEARALALQLHAEFESTRAAAGTPLPVLIRTRPAGARVRIDGRPVVRTVDGRSEEVRTPAVVAAGGVAPFTVVAELEGFEPRRVAVDPRQLAEVDVTLEVVAAHRIAFGNPVQTAVGAGGGWLVAGVRGGRVGIAQREQGQHRVVELAGLKAVDGTPVLDDGRAFFPTNEGSIECLPVTPGAAATGWPVALPSGVATELVAREGRLLAVDRDHVLHAFEQATGARLWSVSLDSPPAGPPTLARRQVFIGTNDGRVLTIDAADGKLAAVLKSPAAVTTRILVEQGVLYFGAADGNLRAVDAADARVLWTTGVGRPLADGDFGLVGDVVVALGGAGELVAFGRGKGERRAGIVLDGQPQGGLRVAEQRVFVALRRAKQRNVPTHDVLQAYASDGLSLQWEFVDRGPATGAFAVDDGHVAWPSADGELVLFR